MTPDVLRARIRKIERRTAVLGRARLGGDDIWRLGVDKVDGRLPGGQIDMGGVHEVQSVGPAGGTAVSGFTLALLARLPRDGDILWCQSVPARREYGALYGPGLARMGIAPGRLIQAGVRRADDLAWALEEGLRSGALAAVVGEGGPLGFTATRRLALAAHETATPCLTLDLSGANQASAATTRWRVAATAGLPDAMDPRGPGFAGWEIELSRARGGRPGSWSLYWNDERQSFDTAVPVREVTAVRPVAGDAARLRRTG